MTKLYDRAFTLTVGGSTVAQLAGDPDNSLRVRFKIQTRTTQQPNHIQVSISNLSVATRQNLVAQGKSGADLRLEAGYVGGSGPIFIGKCYYVIDGRESPTDTALQLFARDGADAYDYSTISKSLAKGSKPIDHFNAFAEAMKQYGITKGYVPEQLLSSPRYPRGVSFAGMTKDYLRTLSASYNCTWSIQMGELQMVPVDGYVPGAPFVLNSTTGLIGMPTQTPTGIMARCLINPAINLGKGNLVQIDQKDIQLAAISPAYTADGKNFQYPAVAADGIYKVAYMEVTGDSRGNDWYQDLTCFAANNLIGVPDNIKLNVH